MATDKQAPKTNEDYARERREEIMLGQAMNQAVQLMAKTDPEFRSKEDAEQAYKETARRFFKLNKELYQEYKEGRI
jgi:hypothetical protein